MDKETAALLKAWRANPLRHFTQTQVRKMFDLGEDSMTALTKLGAPVVAKKINPDHFKQWLWVNRENIQKLT